jgi:hypothetical protein
MNAAMFVERTKAIICIAEITAVASKANLMNVNLDHNQNLTARRRRML